MSNDKNPRDSSRDRRRDRETLGRSRGGLSTKIHLAADGRARPLARVTSAGQRNDALGFEPVMARLRTNRDREGRHDLVIRRAFTGVLALLALLGVLNVFGQRPSTSRAAVARAEVEVYG